MIIKTKNLNVLKAWLIGGQCDQSGNWIEGFHALNDIDQASENGVFDKENIKINNDTLKGNIEYFISENQELIFDYYGDKYRACIPCEKNLKILTNRIAKQLLERFKDQ